MPFGPYVLCAVNDMRSTFNWRAIDRFLSRRLRRVDMKQHTTGRQISPIRLDVLYDADFVYSRA
jgi:hypothetical protein